MARPDIAAVQPLLCCPRCRAGLTLRPQPRCLNESCEYARAPFPVSAGQPVLIDFDESIFSRSLYQEQAQTVVPRDRTSTSIGRILRRFTFGWNTVAEKNLTVMVDHLETLSPAPVVLVIGGGSRGSGSDPLYDASAIQIVGTDVYPSPETVLVCDGHRLPFQDRKFHGVLIQAVLEHVLDPARVAEEIHRVLVPGGIVYADTPFMQQVHEGAYDFTRFTLSGHRWLFRGFTHLGSGASGGPGVAFLWSISYFLRGLGVGAKATAIITALFVWVRWLERFAKPGLAADAASGLFFMGRKSELPIASADLVAYYHQSRRGAVQVSSEP